MHQQNTYQQFPNFTQPPPPIEQSFPSIDDSTIEKFLIDRNHLTIQDDEEKVFNHFEITGRDRLNVIQLNINNLIEQQLVEENYLKSNIAQLSTALWKGKIDKINKNQIKIAELLTKFETLSSELSSSTTSRTIVKKKRRNKRKIKKKKVQQHTNKESENIIEKEEQPKPQKFVGGLEESYEKYEVERLRTANSKRITECRKQLTFLDSLIELRSIRRKNCNVSGSGKASSERNFTEQIDQLKRKWTEALNKFNSHENELKMLLTNTSSQLWLNALFSNDQPAFTGETMDFKKLLEVR